MRRLFIIRKDLHLKPGKLSAMIGHCCEAYWTNQMKLGSIVFSEDGNTVYSTVSMPKSVWNDYVNGIFTKTICEAKNLNNLKKIDGVIKEIGLKEGEDYGYINDKCLTDLTPENPDGTCTIGIWFKPLPDEISHKLSKKYKLYRDE